MLRLDLKETETGAALVLAAVVAGQVAENLGLRACVRGLTDSLSVSLEDGTDRLQEVYVAHLEKHLGQGFLVDNQGGGAVLVWLDTEEEAEEGEVAAAEPDAKAPAKKRRGRPPGKKAAKPATE